MPSPELPPALVPLVGYLDQLEGRARLPDLSTQLRKAEVTPEDVRDFVRFDDRCYQRVLLAEGPWYSMMALCWRSGQRSSIHDHAQSSCAFKVLSGICSETSFEYSACGLVYPLHTSRYPAGTVVATEQRDIHQISNLQPAGWDMVTLHVYTPPLRYMRAFSITGETCNLVPVTEATVLAAP